MPAIYQNVRNWHADASKSKWFSQWEGCFTYDVGSSATGRGDLRREGQCPRTWKGTIASPRCPEANQPQFVPPLYNTNEVGETAMAPQPPMAIEVDLMITYGKDSRFAGAFQPSGCRYSGDESPPASWVEGSIGYTGDGNVPEGNRGARTTYRAPIGAQCDEYNVRGSEQNWQGFVRSFLGRQLELQVEDADMPVDKDTGFSSRFFYPTEQIKA